MDITIDNFENYVPFKILQRGKEYFEDGAVRNLEETEDGEWTAKVEGTKLYKVEITIDSDGSIEWSCNCPYDWGIMCKHVVAVLFAIRQVPKRNSNETSKKKGKTKKKSILTDVVDAEIIEEKDTLVESELNRLMQLVKEDELRNFVVEYAQKDKIFCNTLSNHIRNAHLNKPEKTANDYRNMMVKAFQHSFRSGRSRYHYFEENDWDAIFCQVYQLLEEAKKLLQAGNAVAALSTATQFLISLDEEADESLLYNEDFFVGDYCDEASELILEAINHKSVPDNLKEEITEKLKAISSHSDLCQYYDFDIDELILKLTIATQTDEKALELLDDTIKSHAESYDLYTYVLRKIELLRKMKREKEAEETTLKYLFLPAIRRQEVDKAISQKLYDKAIRLITDGITVAQEQHHYGSEREWMESLLTVYELQQDIPAQAAMCRQLFVMERGSLEYYHKLKKLIPEDEWKSYLKQLIIDTDVVQRGAGQSIVADIYVEEQDWDSLFKYLQTATFNLFETLDIYAYHLRTAHSSELIQMYCDSLKEYAAANLGRDHYERIGKSMICMQKLEGGKEATAKLAEEFRTLYKNRRAMREILSAF